MKRKLNQKNEKQKLITMQEKNENAQLINVQDALKPQNNNTKESKVIYL